MAYPHNLPICTAYMYQYRNSITSVEKFTSLSHTVYEHKIQYEFYIIYED